MPIDSWVAKCPNHTEENLWVIAIIQTMKARLPMDATAEPLDTNATNLHGICHYRGCQR
jgi:hypothetical protein